MLMERLLPFKFTDQVGVCIEGTTQFFISEQGDADTVGVIKQLIAKLPISFNPDLKVK
jgi:hypothetical protein